MDTPLIDARGLACPEPVVQVRRALAETGAGIIVVVVDEQVSAENIERMAGTVGWNVASQRGGREIRLTLTRQAEPAAAPAEQTAQGQVARPPTATVFITSNLFGSGPDELGRVLMRAFVKTLKELQPLPAFVIFANSGVHLTTTGSDLVQDLRELESAGVRILSCGTCLDYFHLKDSLEVGKVSNMFEIASTLAAADRVLRP